MKKDNTQEIGTVGKIIIPKNIQNVIDNLHNDIGSIEWSGILFYKQVKGDFKKLKNLVFNVEFIYPMNIGSSAYTEFEYNDQVMNAYDVREDLIECSTAMVHSHHNMTTFFSVTDTDELFSNCKHYNYYISLIVNFSKKYSCKIAIPSTTKTKYEHIFKNSDGKIVKSISVREEEVIIVGDLDIEFEGGNEIPWLNKRITDLKRMKVAEEQKKAAARVSVGTNVRVFNQPHLNDFNQDNGHYRNWYDDYPTQTIAKKYPTPKEFLTALILVDSSDNSVSLESAIAELLMEENVNPELYDAVISQNLDIIHDNLYGNSNMVNHCKLAIQELQKHEGLFGNTLYYDVIKTNLEVYAV